ncbi:insulinase family protein [Geovibrio thiophilus]|uniref:Insulinase family protein n=1 Tax=Geovibrio thiophilus TaxID=139438 RepID=A0A3R5UZV0_9BACT|nr:M16 family metallopeptidase [Geovibrio thiophilus]QAR33779.1 insulinase family protein [Geovibrio thiophilus]
MMIKTVKNARLLITALIIAIAGGCSLNTAAEANSPEKLPFSDRIIYGKLENGLQYYIRQNDLPQDKVELRLNVRTGSLNETEAERGIAHFVEHMAFNGTRNYQGNDLIKFMEELGLTFGQHSNAYTSSENTHYQLSVPADKEELIKDSFLIMRDWADGITFDEKEIESEKGVITEEWRMRNDVRSRIRNMAREYLLEGSLYPLRDPIGLMEVVASADKALLKGYYDKWYTPENMSVIVVGNIDPVKAEELIKINFSSIEGRKTPQKADTSVPFQDGLRMRTITDPEATSVSLSYNLFSEEGRVETYEHLKQNVLESGAMSMLNKRVASKILEKKSDLLAFRGGKSTMTDSLALTRFSITTRPESIEADIKEMLTEIERVKRYGFNMDELKEFITSQKTYVERAASPDYKFPSDKYAGMIAEYDTFGGHLTEFTQDKVLLNRIFDETNITSYNRAFNRLLESGSRMVIITMPERDADKISLTDEKFLKIQSEAEGSEVSAQAAGGILDRIIDKEPEGGVVKSKESYANVDGELITYGNGVRLFIKYNPVDKNRFMLTAKKPGGFSVMGDEEILYADFMQRALISSGFQGISRRELQTFLAGKRVMASPGVTGNSFDFGGGGDSEDMETMFQLIYKYITAPDIDKNTFEALMKSTTNALESAEKDKKTVFFRDVAEKMFNDKYRRGYLLEADLPNITPDKLMKLYNDYFSGINNFIFVISGDVDREKTAELGRKYLGGLPAVKEKAEAVDRGLRLKESFASAEGFGDVENRSTVMIRFDKDVEYTANGKHYVSVIRRVLNQRMRENIREDMGGVYSVSASISYSDYPETVFSGRVSFTCDPARRDDIIKEVIKTIKDIAENGITEKELETAKSQQSVQYDSAGEENRFWVNNIVFDFIRGEPVLSVAETKEIINGLNLKDINSFAVEYMNDMRIFVASYNPEAKVE